MSDLELKALVFDVFGTVVDWRTSIANEVSYQLKNKGFDLNWLAFSQAWRSKYQPSMEGVRSGRRGYVRLDVLHL